VAELLLVSKADNANDNTGKTPSRVAADKGHKGMAKLLRQHGSYEKTAGAVALCFGAGARTALAGLPKAHIRISRDGQPGV
jgi:ankyrin repeat protein